MADKYIPNQSEDIENMLKIIGLKNFEELFSPISDKLQLNKPLDLPASMTEIEITKKLNALSKQNLSTSDYISFLGGGVYDHYVPSVIDAIVSREEFYTAYTPYQPEISQGTLQAIFEYQTSICNLTKMDVSNASMYDGASSLAEACALSVAHTKLQKVVLPKSMHPDYKKVVETYLSPKNIQIIYIEYTPNGQIDLDVLKKQLEQNNVACVALQSPNFFGVIEDIEAIQSTIEDRKALSIAVIDPLSLGILAAPGQFGIDIVVGDGQSLGSYQNFGGPHFGFFCVTKKLMRKMPGRIVGKTNDIDGRDAYVLTLQAREQHIRREKASSNICSNHALNALRALIYLCITGKQGLSKIATDCANKSEYLKTKLLDTGFFKPIFTKNTFKEFTIKPVISTQLLNKELLKSNILGGIDLSYLGEEFENNWLLAVTEKKSYEELDYFVEEVTKICKENI